MGEEKRKAEMFAHESSMVIMGLVVDLEAHIAHEIEWGHQEGQMVERGNELQESSRITINDIVYQSMQSIGKLVENELSDVDQGVRDKIQKVFATQQHIMNAKMSAAFDT